MIEPRQELQNLKPYETASYPINWDMKLDSNENYIGPSTAVLNALKNMTAEQICHYPYYGELYDILSDFFDTEKECIVITNGADEAISAALNTFAAKNDTILNVTPSFSMPKIYSEIIGAKYKEIPYKTKWEYPYDDVVNAVTDDVKVIILTTPNNPTGDIIPLEQIVEILEKFPDKAVVIDETYSSYAGISNICLCDKYDNAVIIKSFSKDYALAGLRLGCVVSRKDNIENIKKVLNPYNVNNAAVEAAKAALNDENYLNIVKNEIARSKMFLSDELKKMGFEPYISHANFILADFGSKSDLIYEKLKSNKILVKNFPNNPMLSNCLRITIPTMSGAQKITNLIKSKDTLVFDMDGVMVDVSDSYFEAIKHTYKYFTGKELSIDIIHRARMLGGLNNDWDLTHYLIKQYGFNFSYDDIVKVFQKQYWDDGNGSINTEKLLIKPELLDELSKKYNLTVFTGRPKEEALYTLNKFGIAKYFQKIVTMNDVPSDRQKPHTDGLKLIKESLITDELIYFGDTVDDAKCACDFGAYGVGVLPPSDKTEELKALLLAKGSKAVIHNINELNNILETKTDEKQSDYTKN